MKYDIIDHQTGDYYEEDITLAEARDTAARLVERSLDEEGEEYRADNEHLLYLCKHIDTAKEQAFGEINSYLWIFDYELVEREGE